MKLNGLGYFQGPDRPSSPQGMENSDYGVGPAQYLCCLFQQTSHCFIFLFCNGGEVVAPTGHLHTSLDLLPPLRANPGRGSSDEARLWTSVAVRFCHKLYPHLQ